MNPWKHVFKIEVPTFKPHVIHETLCSLLPEEMKTDEDTFNYRLRKLCCLSYGRVENVRGRLVKALLITGYTDNPGGYVCSA